MAADPAPNPKAVGEGDRPRAHTGSSDAEVAVFDALKRLLVRESLRDISVSQIITEAGISRATFYFYFSSKFAVATRLIAVVMDELAAELAPALRPANAPEDMLRKRLEAMASVWSRHRPILRAVSENWHAAPELRAIWLQMIESSTDALAREIVRQRAVRGAPLGPEPRRIAAAVIWATERTLYIAGPDIDDDLPGEREVVDLLAPLWAAAVYG
jgi:TetR/AcrR family transcriptional regulator, ethionamide resistance regulator